MDNSNNNNNNNLILNNIENEYNEIFQIPLELLVEDQENLKDLTCPICFQLLKSPAQCMNGHMFCLSCIEKSIKKSNQCAVCRSFLNMKTVSRSLFVERAISKLKVFCRYRFKVDNKQQLQQQQQQQLDNGNNSNSCSGGNSGIIGLSEPDFSIDYEGCNHIESLENISNHEKNCIYRYEKCKYNMNYLNNNSVGGIVLPNLSVNNKNLVISDNNDSLNNSPNSKSPRIINNNSSSGVSINNSIIDINNENGNDGSSGVNIKKLKEKEKNKNSVIISTASPEIKSCGIIRFKDLEKHYEVCPYRPTLCGYCKCEFYELKIKEHEENCDMRKVECEKCQLPVARKEIKLHLNEQCPNQIIKCTFGCDKEFERKDLIEHLSQSLATHMIMMKQQHQNEISTLKKELNHQIQLKEEKIKSLEKTIRERVLDSKIKIEWKVKNYTDCKKAGYVQSEKFVIKGFPFFIGFFVDGDSHDSKGYISIYLFLDTSDIQRGKSLSIDFSLKFINQKDQTQSLQRTYSHIAFPIGTGDAQGRVDGQGWGDRRSIRTNVLESAGFIKDNTLFITSEITVKKEFFQVEDHNNSEKH